MSSLKYILLVDWYEIVYTLKGQYIGIVYSSEAI